MNWQIEWKALSANIQGILDAGSFFYTALHNSSEDSRSVKKKILLKNAEKIFENLKLFFENNQAILPEATKNCFSTFINQPEFQNSDFFSNPGIFESGNTQFSLTSLAAFQSEFNYLIADTQIIARRITERSFIHLQRCIIVDEDVRKKWKNAFKLHETNCEKLGAIHLLHHGVWAFKADAVGGRTDLILNEPLSSTSMIEETADTLVLTEWKLVKKEAELETKIKEARKQTEIYQAEVLGGIEIKNYRYLIFVTENRLRMPDDLIENGAIFRHINIAVNPMTPSKEARR